MSIPVNVTDPRADALQAKAKAAEEALDAYLNALIDWPPKFELTTWNVLAYHDRINSAFDTVGRMIDESRRRTLHDLSRQVRDYVHRGWCGR